MYYLYSLKDFTSGDSSERGVAALNKMRQA